MPNPAEWDVPGAIGPDEETRCLTSATWLQPSAERGAPFPTVLLPCEWKPSDDATAEPPTWTGLRIRRPGGGDSAAHVDVVLVGSITTAEYQLPVGNTAPESPDPYRRLRAAMKPSRLI